MTPHEEDVPSLAVLTRAGGVVVPLEVAAHAVVVVDGTPTAVGYSLRARTGEPVDVHAGDRLSFDGRAAELEAPHRVTISWAGLRRRVTCTCGWAYDDALGEMVSAAATAHVREAT